MPQPITGQGTAGHFVLWTASDEVGESAMQQNGSTITWAGNLEVGNLKAKYSDPFTGNIEVEKELTVGEKSTLNGPLFINGEIWVGTNQLNNAYQLTLGGLIKSLTIRDNAGNAVGYVPIYDSIT